MARAIGDTIRENILILTNQYSMDRDLINHGYMKKEEYLQHVERATFMELTKSIYETGNYRVEKIKNDYEYSFRYQLAIFSIGELKK